MKYSKEVYEKTKSVLDSRRIKAETDAEKRRVEFAKVHPELLVIEDELTKTGLEAVKAVIGGSGDVKKTVEELMKTNLQLQKDRENLLLSAGVDKNYLNLIIPVKYVRIRATRTVRYALAERSSSKSSQVKSCHIKHR